MNATAALLNPDTLGNPPVLLPINAVERETGVTKELLRMWERRYSFPTPLRDAQGDRIYTMEQVAKLRLLRRLIDHGFRPGKIIHEDIDGLERLLRAQSRPGAEIPPELEQELLSVLKAREPGRVRDYLSHQLIKMGLQHFITDFLQHANVIVGDAWMRGLIEVHEEHLFTEQVQMLIRQAMGNLREADQPPRLLLTTPPEENHTLGILMVEALLRLEGVDAICFGAQMPARDVVQATQKHKMQVVALSFSASYPTTRAIEYLEDVRFRLPASVAVWAGGTSLRSTRRSVEGVQFIHELAGLRQAVHNWRAAMGRRT